MLDVKIKYLVKQLNCASKRKLLNNELTKVCSFKHKSQLPQIAQAFYEHLGYGYVGSKSDYIIFDIFFPEFYNKSEAYDVNYHGVDTYFDFEKKHLLENIIIIGSDVDGNLFGIDISKNSDTIVSQWKVGGRDYSNFFSYIESILGEHGF